MPTLIFLTHGNMILQYLINGILSRQSTDGVALTAGEFALRGNRSLPQNMSSATPYKINSDSQPSKHKQLRLRPYWREDFEVTRESGKLKIADCPIFFLKVGWNTAKHFGRRECTGRWDEVPSDYSASPSFPRSPHPATLKLPLSSLSLPCVNRIVPCLWLATAVT